MKVHGAGVDAGALLLGLTGFVPTKKKEMARMVAF
jgi:hypothetical protein